MTKLERLFHQYNRQYFNGELPDDTLVKWAHITPVKCMGGYEDGHIYINIRLKPWAPAWKSTLLHEMAHLATDSERAEHGPRWDKVMKRLYRMGAFDKLL
ncbi:MAG TPA: SprT-like domain-containing protein [Ktedonobacteraceae bacterium]|nr:SprT-like domain-containing protein [Ktedonobacteraceae bacterium]